MGYEVQHLQWIRFNNVKRNEIDDKNLRDLEEKEHLIYVSKDWSQFKINEVCNIGAKNNWIDLLEWCHKTNKPKTAETCRIACDFGNLEALQLLRQQNCEWNEKSVSVAAYNGFLHILIWARENGCPWNDYTCKYSVKQTHINDYLKKQKCPCLGFYHK